jgi:hypothetical protein
MGFTVVALAAGVLLGFATGGRPSNLRRRPLQLVSLLAISALLQVVAEVFDVPDTVGLSMVLVSYVGLTAFALANVRVVGMLVVLVGLLCNLAVIGVNGGMPVRRSAIVAAHAATAAEISSIDFGTKRHLAGDGDALSILGDIIPVRPSREVLSFGDLILAFGIADVVFRLLRPVELGRRRRDDHLIDLAGDARRAHADTLVTA